VSRVGPDLKKRPHTAIEAFYYAGASFFMPHGSADHVSDVIETSGEIALELGVRLDDVLDMSVAERSLMLHWIKKRRQNEAEQESLKFKGLSKLLGRIFGGK